MGKVFNNDNLADVGFMSEGSMLEIPFENNFFNVPGSIEEVDPKELMLLANNPMNMDQDENYKALLYSIQETGVWKENPIVVEKRDDGSKVVMSGNRRTLIAQQLNLEKVPVVYKAFNSESERRRFVDSANNHRNPKLIDILNRYELNAKLYDEGYWANSAVGRLKKLDAVAAIIGYPVSKLHNIRFLLDIKKDYEKIINLIDEDVIVVNDIRKLHLLASKGKLVDYEGVLKAICDDSVINDSEAELKIRKAAAKEIIKGAEVKGKKKNIKEANMKKAHVVLKDFRRSLSKTLAEGLEAPTTQMQKDALIDAIEDIIDSLKEYKESVVRRA